MILNTIDAKCEAICTYVRRGAKLLVVNKGDEEAINY